MPHTAEGDGRVGRNLEPLAIVGMSCTLAGGVDSPQKLWETLLNKEIKQSARVPESRFNIDAYFHENAFGQPAAISSKGGFFLDTELHAFDAEFFGYDADEARHMDPQHFRILESVYECLESAGRTKEDVQGTNTAVFIGNFSLDQVAKSVRNSYDDRHLHEVIGVDPGLLSSRISYCYDMYGPVYTTNTGCTSSLFALHSAAMALRGGECNAALVGGVNLLQGPEAYSSYSKFGIISADSMCHTFDARCNGYCRAEGVGALYVRLLSDAIRDNDPIRGVIRSIAVNSNGFVPGMPLFVPNQQGLERSMHLAYAQANLDPYETAYIETHGIGMPLGEIAEAHAVGKAMNQPKRRDTPMRVGSLKPNFGHQEAASGIFVMIKAAMMTEAGVIPAHADYQSPHPANDMNELNIRPQTETIDWPAGYSRRVGCNSYAWSGTNVHVVVEDVGILHPGYASTGKPRGTPGYDHSTSRPLLITFSAFSRSSLDKNIAKHAEIVEKYYLADLAYTLNVKRSKFSHRAYAVVSDGVTPESLLSSLKYGVTGKEKLKLTLTFGDVSADLHTLAVDLLQHFPVFAQALEKLDGVLADAGIDAQLSAYFAGRESTSTLPAEKLAVLRGTAVHLALVDLLAHLAIAPDIIDRSSNEPAADYFAGAITNAEAILKTAQGTIDPIEKNTTKTTSPAITLTIGADIDHPITSLPSLLHAAGELFLHAHPLNLSHANTTPSTPWAPRILTDLPPYQWNHSSFHTAESYANKEHRTNKHAYHTLLGRRVFGLSDRVKVWKNKLSFQDLPTSIPWIPNPKPEITLRLSHFISMAVEALFQVVDEDVREVVIADLELCKVLRYAEDVDLIELQTSIVKMPGHEEVYGIAFQSVKEGVWMTHAEGTTSMVERVDSPIAAEADRVETSCESFDVDTVLGEEKGRRYRLHPRLVEVALRLVREPAEIEGIGRVRAWRTQGQPRGSWSTAITASGGVELRDDCGQMMLSMGGVY